MHSHSEPAPSKLRKYASTAVQGTLGIIGFGTGAMYLAPAIYVARYSDAGTWLSNLTSTDFATGVFTAGGLDWAMVNAYFSSKSVQNFVDYTGRQPTIAAKLTKSGAIIFYVLTQDFSQYLTSAATTTNQLETLATIAGNTPGALYAGVGVMENEIPYIWSQLKKVTEGLRYGIQDKLSPVSDVDKLYRARVIHYRQQHAIFIQHVQENWRYISSHAGELTVKSDANALDSIFAENIHGIPTTMLSRVVHRLGQLIGVAGTLNYTAAFTVNTFKGIVPFIPSLPLQLLAVAFLQSSAFYGNIKVTTGGTTSLLDGLLNLVRGNPIESLAYHLRPKTTAGIAAATIPLSAFSYAVSDFMFLNQFPGKNEGLRRILRITSNASMSFYHVAGLLHFYTLMLGMLTPDKREQAFFAMEKEVERLEKMTMNEFMDFAESNDAMQNKRYQIEPFHAAPADCNGVPTVYSPVAHTSSTGSWFSWFKRQPAVVQPEKSVDDLVGEFEQFGNSK